jgi:hypothetical protein
LLVAKGDIGAACTSLTTGLQCFQPHRNRRQVPFRLVK